MSHGAGCLCGAVRVSIDAEPLSARQCWCRLCQYLSSGGSTVNVVFPAEAVTVTGEVRWRRDLAESGNTLERGFCPECGTPLFSRAVVRPHLVIVRAGALDDPGLLRPQSVIWTSEAPVWACLDPALPRHPRGQPPAP